jgi:hypothetical protein
MIIGSSLLAGLARQGALLHCLFAGQDAYPKKLCGDEPVGSDSADQHDRAHAGTGCPRNHLRCFLPGSSQRNWQLVRLDTALHYLAA